MKKNVCKICRRVGQKLFLKGDRCFSPKCALIKKSYPPGTKGKRRRRRVSGFGQELREKQKLRNWYGLSEEQFKKYIRKTLDSKKKGEDLEEELIKKFEKRLDNVIFRSGLAKSRKQARQLVSHGFFLVNQKPVDSPSFEVEKEDIVSVKEQKKQKNILKELKILLKKKEAPSWLKVNKEELELEIVGEPNLEEASPPADIPVIFEFYSR